MASSLAVEFHDQKLPARGTLVFFLGKKKQFGQRLQKLDERSNGHISRAVKQSSFDAERGKCIEILSPARLDFSRILLVGLGGKLSNEDLQWTKLGGKLSDLLKDGSRDGIAIIPENGEKTGKDEEFSPRNIAALAGGLVLKQYEFDRYKVKSKGKTPDKKNRISSIGFYCRNPKESKRIFQSREGVRAGTFLARDLVNEPANILGPVEFALRMRDMEKFGIEVNILDETEMAARGMNALLAVGQGSKRESRLVVMHWKGNPQTQNRPVAIVGKGVCFDSGGISIKPSAGMEDMKGDMAGAACVAGLMHSLAVRKSSANVVGVIGLAENMPDGNAQRPGDIVTSMSGQTIEVINTDAEGRLVLADALTYTIQSWKPGLVIDLATLTGAILVALGKEYAGLFSNNERLAARLVKAGEKTGEKLWRMPLGKKYDKLIDSRIADMKNSGGRLAGSTTAAQFLQRYVGNIPWAHLDIAGTAMASPKNDVNSSWGSGFGVHLLDEYISSNHE